MEEDEVEVGVEGKENAENILPQGIEMQTRKRKEKKDGKEDGGEGDPLFKIEGKLDKGETNCTMQLITRHRL